MPAAVETLSLFDQPPAAPVSAPQAGHGPSEPAATARSGPAALLAVDGNALVHRAFHGHASASRGPLQGVATMLCAVVEQAAPQGVLVGFDGPPERSRRRERCPAYKAHRPATDPELRRLLGEAAAWLAACGVTVVHGDGWEADDVVASAARACEEAGWACLIASSDRDVCGAVSEATTVLDFRRGVRHVQAITPRRLRRRPGVEPGQYVEYAALRGDPSDNLAGVPGIGPHRAAALLRAYASVDDAATDELGLRSVLGSQPARALRADLDGGAEGSRFRRNVALMTLRRDLAVDVTACRPASAAETVAAACESAGVPGVASRAAVALGAG
jgi:DNA polymerase-1